MAIFRAADPARRHPRLCCECEGPALFGEPTCGNVECIRSLRAAMFEDVDGDEQREATV